MTSAIADRRYSKTHRLASADTLWGGHHASALSVLDNPTEGKTKKGPTAREGSGAEDSINRR